MRFFCFFFWFWGEKVGATNKYADDATKKRTIRLAEEGCRVVSALVAAEHDSDDVFADDAAPLVP